MFLHSKELQGESGEPPKCMRNQDGSHGLNGNSGSLIKDYASLEDFIEPTYPPVN